MILCDMINTIQYDMINTIQYDMCRISSMDSSASQNSTYISYQFGEKGFEKYRFRNVKHITIIYPKTKKEKHFLHLLDPTSFIMCHF